jgi:glycosyltransferase involved in cell wall biosynthesis
MNILLINHYAGSRKHGMEYRPFYLGREWVRLGHKVTIVAASFSHLRTQSLQFNGNIREEEIDGIHYIWLKTPKYHGNSVRRATNIFAFVWQLLWRRTQLINDCQPDVVIASSTYPLDIIPAHWIAKKNDAQLVFEVHDLWPLSLIELGGMSRRHPFIIILQWAENFAYHRADCILSMLPHAMQYMSDHGMSPHKFEYLPNGIDVLEWQNSRMPLPEIHLEALSKLKQKDHFVVGYVGSHGLANALQTLIESVALVREHPASFVLVGHGPEKKTLEDMASRRGLKNVIFLPPVPKASIPSLLAEMDALYIGWKKSPLYEFGVSPNKLMDYMMAGKPVIHAIEAGNDLVSESGCGISIPPEDPSEIAWAVMHLMKMSAAKRKKMGAKGKKYVLAHHDYRILAKQFIFTMREAIET